MPLVTDESKVTHSNGTASKKSEPPKSGFRDFAAEARGKVASAAYTACIQSPGIASFAKDEKHFRELVVEYAELIQERVWKAQNG